MKPQKLTPITLAFICFACVSASCDKEKPEEKNLPVEQIAAAPFTLSAVETRNEHEYAWTISRDGKTDSVEEDFDEMYVTGYNKLVVTVMPEGDGEFPGYNVRSSNSGAVEVVDVTPTSFRLKRASVPKGTEATIEVWNGTGSSERKISFKVNSKYMIEPQKFTMWVDGKKIEIPLYNSYEECAQNVVTILEVPESEKDVNTNVIHEVVFGKVIPENTTYDTISISRIYCNKPWLGWLKENQLEFSFCTTSSNQYFGGLLDLYSHNKTYTCLRPWGVIFSDEICGAEGMGYILIRLFKDSSNLVSKWCAVAIKWPFSSYEDMSTWIDNNWCIE